MGMLDNFNDPDRARQRRYKLYDRIVGRVSVNTMNIVVGVVAALLVAAIVVGIVTGNPQ